MAEPINIALTIKIPVDKAVEVLDILCDPIVFNYQYEVDDGNGVMIPNSQTKQQFVKSKIIEFVKDKISYYKTYNVIKNAPDDVKSEIDLIEIA